MLTKDVRRLLNLLECFILDAEESTDPEITKEQVSKLKNAYTTILWIGAEDE